MSYPTTEEGMERAGSTKLNISACKTCGQDMQWWNTKNGKNIPLVPGTVKMHREVCGRSTPSNGHEAHTVPPEDAATPTSQGDVTITMSRKAFDYFRSILEAAK